ncbi:MAG: hypothetical protein PVJ57_01860 [Phycisphaerae bacterium]
MMGTGEPEGGSDQEQDDRQPTRPDDDVERPVRRFHEACGECSNQGVIDRLAEQGVRAFHRPHDFLHPLTGVLGVVDVHEFYPPVLRGKDRSLSSGRTFWMHWGADLLFVGTWSARLYFFAGKRTPESVVEALWTLPRTVVLPQSFCEQHDIYEVSALEYRLRRRRGKRTSASHAGQSRGAAYFTQGEFLEQAQGVFDACEMDAGRVIHLSVGKARAFTRFGLGEDVGHDELAVILYGVIDEISEPTDHLALIDMFLEVLNTDKVKCLMPSVDLEDLRREMGQ